MRAAYNTYFVYNYFPDCTIQNIDFCIIQHDEFKILDMLTHFGFFYNVVF